jgi:hypothetical protein
VLPGPQRLHRPLDVKPVGQRDVHGCDARNLDERVVASVRPLDPVLPGVRLGPRLIPAGDGNDISTI